MTEERDFIFFVSLHVQHSLSRYLRPVLLFASRPVWQIYNFLHSSLNTKV